MPGPAFAGVAPVTSFCEWEPTKANPVEGDHRLYGILTMEANRVVGAHPSEGDAGHPDDA
jgi:hypothetical protein